MWGQGDVAVGTEVASLLPAIQAASLGFFSWDMSVPGPVLSSRVSSIELPCPPPDYSCLARLILSLELAQISCQAVA